MISSRSRRRTSRSSDGVRRGSSSRSSRPAQRRRATRAVRRRASVGWAVRTGAMDSRPSSSSRSAIVRAAAAQRDHGLGHGIVEDAVAGRPFAAAERPDPAARLGQVDELEVQREGLDDRLGATRGRGPRGPRRAGAAPRGRRPGAGRSPAGGRARRARTGPGRPARTTTWPSSDAEQADLRGERVARAGRADPGRFGAHRARRRAPLAGAHATAQPCGPQRFATFPASQPFEAITFPTLVR